ncbi:anti-sigma F factor [Acetanaerobacterium elongatum]|uniref:Anti-sigma F factor n=1 Tax=Acetanaerobacterium elongatum TaxID=258515 RepID=A0A1H0EU28_9FIRM|nr:anti-sigma F factor [Acetanaerobacterium elongatum]SDN85957.1 stage II sporulation protein AB (anti-sigma F factor) [Acetanaerobacterium elongatum]
MKCINEMSLTFPSKSSNEGFARVSVSAFFSQLDPTVDELADVKTAVSEAVTNCIIHAYKDRIGLVYINARIFEGGKIRIKIRDKGCGIADVAQAMEPMFTSCQGGERAGLGFAVMQSFMDKVTVISRVGKGTTVTLSKTIKSRGMADD